MARYNVTPLGLEKVEDEQNDDLGELVEAIYSIRILREHGKLNAPLDNTVAGLEWWFISMIDKITVVGRVIDQINFRTQCFDRSDAVKDNLKILVDRGWVEEVKLPAE